MLAHVTIASIETTTVGNFISQKKQKHLKFDKIKKWQELVFVIGNHMNLIEIWGIIMFRRKVIER